MGITRPSQGVYIVLRLDRSFVFRFAALGLFLGSRTHAPAASLITAADQVQLETWLGEGALTLTNIFTKITGDGPTSLDFHVALDGKERTIPALDVLNATG